MVLAFLLQKVISTKIMELYFLYKPTTKSKIMSLSTYPVLPNQMLLASPCQKFYLQRLQNFTFFFGKYLKFLISIDSFFEKNIPYKIRKVVRNISKDILGH